MKTIRYFVLAAALAVSACASVEPASRADTEITPLAEINVSGASPILATPQYDVKAVRVSVPRALKVSEANLYYPIADIVWRGEERGDRYAQVSAIFNEAAGRAISGMTEGRPVYLDIEVLRFHALTEKTRYSFGGSYSLKFKLSLSDAETGALVAEPQVIDASVAASGGQRAIEEEARGLTQKVVIEQALQARIYEVLSKPVPITPIAAEQISMLGLAETVGQ